MSTPEAPRGKPHGKVALIKKHGILIVNALFVSSLFIVGVVVLGLHWGVLRQVAGWVFLGVFFFGGGLWLAASWEPPNSNRGKVWGELGRSLLVAGLMAFAVWAVAELRRPAEARHSLQLTLGAQQAMPGIDLHGEDLSKFDLSRKNLSNADLEGANLSGASLVGTNLSDANLSGADLSEAEMKEADLSGASLAGAQLDDASAALVDLREASMPEADLSGAELSGAELQGACLSGASLVNTFLPNAHLEDADLYRADLESTHFWWDMSAAYLNSVGLRGALHTKTAHWPPRMVDRYDALVHPRELDPPPATPSQSRRSGEVRLVSDGDTVALNIEREHRTRILKARLIGIYSPGLREAGGLPARSELRHLLPKGTRVTYAYDAKSEDELGRQLLYVFTPDGGLVNQEMVEQGFAIVPTNPEKELRNLRYADSLRKGEAWARKHAVGVWKDCPP